LAPSDADNNEKKPSFMPTSTTCGLERDERERERGREREEERERKREKGERDERVGE